MNKQVCFCSFTDVDRLSRFIGLKEIIISMSVILKVINTTNLPGMFSFSWINIRWTCVSVYISETWVHQNYTGCNIWPKITCSKVFNWLTVWVLSCHSQSKLLTRITLHIKKRSPLVSVKLIVLISYSTLLCD